VLLIAGLVGMVLDRHQVATQLAAQFESLMGPAGRELVHAILTTTTAQGGTWATVVGLVTLVIGATAVFGELQATLNLIWEVRPAPTGGVWAGICALLKERLFSLTLVFALTFLLLVSLVVSAALAAAADLIRLSVNVLVTVRMAGVRAAQQATATIPIVSGGADALPQARQGARSTWRGRPWRVRARGGRCRPGQLAR